MEPTLELELECRIFWYMLRMTQKIMTMGQRNSIELKVLASYVPDPSLIPGMTYEHRGWGNS